MTWLSGPLSEIFGIPTFCIIRIAKILQFLSGFYIIIDIVGIQRIERFSARSQRNLQKVVQSDSLGKTGKVLFEYGKNVMFVLVLSPLVSILGDSKLLISQPANRKLNDALSSFQRRRDQSPYNRAMLIISLLFGIFVATLAYSEFEPGRLRLSAATTVVSVIVTSLLPIGEMAFCYQVARYLDTKKRSTLLKIEQVMSYVSIGGLLLVLLGLGLSSISSAGSTVELEMNPVLGWGLLLIVYFRVIPTVILDIGLTVRKYVTDANLEHSSPDFVRRLLTSPSAAGFFLIVTLAVVVALSIGARNNPQYMERGNLFVVGVATIGVLAMVFGFVWWLFLALAFVPSYVVLAAVLLLISSIVRIMARFVEWVIDLGATIIVGVLKRRPLARIFLYLSFVFLVIGSFMELAAS